MSDLRPFRFVLLLALAAQPHCSVYDPSLLDEPAGSSTAGRSIGGAAGAANGGPLDLGGLYNLIEGGDSGSAGESRGAGSNGEAGAPSVGGANCSAAGAGAGGSDAAATGGLAGSGGNGGNGGGPSAGGGAGGGAAGDGAAGKASAGSGGTPGPDPCDRKNWAVTASESSPGASPAQAIDGDGGTRWSSGAAQIGGEWFRIDLGAAAVHLTQVVLDTSAHPTDFPVNYKLEFSSDGSTYVSVAAGSGSSITTIKVSDRSARYLKLTQTGNSLSWWSIHELSISCQSN